jgi:lipid-binding SYLF domain-containing protein
MRTTKLALAALAGLLVVGGMMSGCATAPRSDEGRATLRSDVDATRARMKTVDPFIETLIGQSAGYVIFPSVGRGGLVVGGAFGRGEVYRAGNFIGFADITQMTVGAQAGGQRFSQLILFENDAAVDRFTRGSFRFSANASAVIMQAGAAASARYTDGVMVFVQPQGGLMLEASIGGQTFSFQPK